MSKIVEKGPADKDGGLQIQDKVVEVCGVQSPRLTHPLSSSSGAFVSACVGKCGRQLRFHTCVCQSALR